MLVFRCSCMEVLSIPEEQAGALGVCPTCGAVIRAPANAQPVKRRLHAARRAAEAPEPSAPPAAPA